MGKTPQDRGFKFEWERTVAKCRLGAATKSVAAWLSHHANTFGRGAHPGVRLLAFETEQGESTVRRSLELLRDLGLIVRVVHGSRAGKRHFADEYMLAIPDDLEARVRVQEAPAPQRGGHGRGGKANHVRWHERRGIADPTCVHCAEQQGTPREGSMEGFGEGSSRDLAGVPGSLGEPRRKGAASIRPPLGRISDQRSDGSDHRSVEEYQQAFPNKDLPHHSAPGGAGARASSRAADDTYKTFVSEQLAARIQPGEDLTDEDDEELLAEIDYDYVVHIVGELDAVEESTALGMLRNLHPCAVVNEIRRMRREVA